jgi:tRNA threonylcarbamoyladenosine biosynthesis protein TsaB
MIRLAFDTATPTTSVALLDGGEVRAQRERDIQTHGDVLLGLIDDTLRAAGVRIADVGGIAVGAGPGSFTGLRIGLATAKGLCFAGGLPLWTVSSLAALALDAGAPPGTAVVPVLDARKQEVFAAAYRIAADGMPDPLCEARVLAPARLGEILRLVERAIVLGTGALAYADSISDLGAGVSPGARATPSAASIGRLADRASPHTDLASVTPAYVRLSEAELQWGSDRKHIP